VPGLLGDRMEAEVIQVNNCRECPLARKSKSMGADEYYCMHIKPSSIVNLKKVPSSCGLLKEPEILVISREAEIIEVRSR